MSYKDSRFGSTKIIEERFDNLSVSWDYDDSILDLEQRKVVFLYTPDLKHVDKYGCPEHCHIELTQKQARNLRDWLIEFFKDIDDESRI